MTLANSYQHTLLIPKRLIPSKSGIRAILPPLPHGRFRKMPHRGCSVAPGEAAPDLGTASAHAGNREFPAGGYTAAAGARPSPRPHTLQAMRATPRPKKTGPEQAAKRRGAAGPRTRGARPGRRLHPLPSAEQSAAARPRQGPPYLLPLSADGAEHIGSLQNAGEEELAGAAPAGREGTAEEQRERRARRCRGKAAGAERGSTATGAASTHTAMHTGPSASSRREESGEGRRRCWGGRDRLRSVAKRVRLPRPPRPLRLRAGGDRRRAPGG